jgi:predicted metal-dependent hydrolase
MIVASTSPIEIPVRREIAFDFSRTPAVHHAGNPYVSHYWNTLSILGPSVERPVIKALRRALADVQDTRLRRDVQAFLAQEGLHTHHHRRFNDHLATLGYDLSPVVARVDATLDAYLGSLGLEAMLATTIAGEHVIYELARPLVQDPRTLADMDPEVRRLFVWHALEEMEHQSVAGDVYRQLFGESVPWNRRAQAFHAATRLLLRTSQEIYSALLIREPERTRADLFDAWRFMLLSPGYARRVGARLPRFLLPSFRHWERREDDLFLIRSAATTL